MQIRLLWCLAVALACVESTANAVPVAADVARAFVRSQTLTQGDLASLRAAQVQFTPSGLIAFNRKMNGFLDNDGAPTFSQEFIPKGEPVIVKQDNDTMTIRISGTLKQTHDISPTIYPGSFEVDAVGTPPEIVDFTLSNTAHQAK